MHLIAFNPIINMILTNNLVKSCFRVLDIKMCINECKNISYPQNKLLQCLQVTMHTDDSLSIGYFELCVHD